MMKMFTKILLITALLAQQTALFATQANRQAVKNQTEAAVLAAFDLNSADALFSFMPSVHCSKMGANNLEVTGSLKMGGLKDSKQTPSLSAFPNPTKGTVKISMSNPGNENYRIRISNTIGKVVRTVESADIVAAGSNGVEIDLTNLPPGIYFYSLMVNDKMVETKRLVLQN